MFFHSSFMKQIVPSCSWACLLWKSGCASQEQWQIPGVVLMLYKGEEKIVREANWSRLACIKLRGIWMILQRELQMVFKWGQKPSWNSSVTIGCSMKSSKLFFFAVTSVFLPPLIYSKCSCHQHPNAFAVSHISLNHTFLVLPKWEVKESGRETSKQWWQILKDLAFRNSS